jgi:hypothetical protein
MLLGQQDGLGAVAGFPHDDDGLTLEELSKHPACFSVVLYEQDPEVPAGPRGGRQPPGSVPKSPSLMRM